jgi:hypothetical protein
LAVAYNLVPWLEGIPDSTCSTGHSGNRKLGQYLEIGWKGWSPQLILSNQITWIKKRSAFFVERYFCWWESGQIPNRYPPHFLANRGGFQKGTLLQGKENGQGIAELTFLKNAVTFYMRHDAWLRDLIKHPVRRS